MNLLQYIDIPSEHHNFFKSLPHTQNVDDIFLNTSMYFKKFGSNLEYNILNRHLFKSNYKIVAPCYNQKLK
jgi:hypothetical protein